MPFLFFLLLLGCGPAPTASQPTVPVADSTLLTEPAGRWALNRSRPLVQLTLTAPQPVGFRAGGRYTLCFDSVQVLQQPDGVYEVYGSRSVQPTARLQPESPYFVNVLDTYTLTAAGRPGQACVAIPPANDLLAAGTVVRYYVTIRFRGNQLANGQPSTETGSLTGGGVRLQVAR